MRNPADFHRPVYNHNSEVSTSLQTIGYTCIFKNMLAAGHTKVLMNIFKLVGTPHEFLYHGKGSLMVLGNLLPDTLPLVGASPLITHDTTRGRAVAKEIPPLGLGIMTHLYADNITHCGELENRGSYEKSYALSLGAKWFEASRGRFDKLLKRIQGKSLPYVLHIITEIAFDVILAKEDSELPLLIGNTWGNLSKYSPGMLLSLAGHFEMHPEQITEKLREIQPKKRPSFDEIYSRRARALLFIRKFTPDLEEGDEFSSDDVETAIEMITLGENIVQPEIKNFVEECAVKILEYDSNIGEFIRRLKERG